MTSSPARDMLTVSRDTLGVGHILGVSMGMAKGSSEAYTAVQLPTGNSSRRSSVS